VSWSPVHPNQELGQSVPPLWSLSLGFLPVGTAALHKGGGGGELAYNLMQYHGQIMRLAP